MPTLKAGAAKRIITPRGNLFLAGYGPVFLPWGHRKSTGVHDDIYARCLALSDDQTTLAFVALDFISFLQGDMEAIRTRVQEKLGRRDVMVAVGTIHTHSSPDTTGAYGGVPRSYKELVREQASDAVVEAVQGLTPARIGFASAVVPNTVKNVRDPEHGPVDEGVEVMLVEAEAGGTIAVLVNSACHVDVVGSRNFLITADFPAYLRRDIERERGGTAILFVGAQGDLYPVQSIEDHHDEKGLRTYEEAEKLGSVIARACLDALADVKTTADASLAVRVSYPELPIENRMFKILRLLRILRRPTHKGMVRSETWVVDVGDAQIVTLPGQFFCKLGQEIKAQMKGTHKFLFGLTCDDLVYIVPPDEWDPKRKREEEFLSLGINTWPSFREQMPPL
jgi:hypothetical protein